MLINSPVTNGNSAWACCVPMHAYTCSKMDEPKTDFWSLPVFLLPVFVHIKMFQQTRHACLISKCYAILSAK